MCQHKCAAVLSTRGPLSEKGAQPGEVPALSADVEKRPVPLAAHAVLETRTGSCGCFSNRATAPGWGACPQSCSPAGSALPTGSPRAQLRLRKMTRQPSPDLDNGGKQVFI